MISYDKIPILFLVTKMAGLEHIRIDLLQRGGVKPFVQKETCGPSF